MQKNTKDKHKVKEKGEENGEKKKRNIKTVSLFYIFSLLLLIPFFLSFLFHLRFFFVISFCHFSTRKGLCTNTG